MREYGLLSVIVVVGIIGGCSYHYPVNKPLENSSAESGYRFENLAAEKDADETFIILTFSGGGKRASALSYGVMRQLEQTVVSGDKGSLLDDVDVISSVSGGSFTAAHYALFGKEMFDKDSQKSFENEYLKVNTEKVLAKTLFSIGGWMRMWSTMFSRTDLASDYYNQHLFGGMKYGDLVERNERPFIILNATDMSEGSVFTFTRDHFDLIYSELSSVSISRAVAASSALPIVFSPITMRNYAGSDGYFEPGWVARGLARKDLPRLYRRAKQSRSYADVEKRPYIHLVDGGVADNLGLKAILLALRNPDDLGSENKELNVVKMVREGKTRQVVVIVVNAQPKSKNNWSKKPIGPWFTAVASVSLTAMMRNYTFETMLRLRERMANLEDEYGDAGVEFYVVEVDLKNIEDEKARQYLMDVPTRFTLPHEAIDKLIYAGARLLCKSNEFVRFVADIEGTVIPLTNTQNSDMGNGKSME